MKMNYVVCNEQPEMCFVYPPPVQATKEILVWPGKPYRRVEPA
jgi:hypothetical protein